MAIRRLRLKLWSLFAGCLVCICIIGLSTRNFVSKQQQFAVGHEFDYHASGLTQNQYIRYSKMETIRRNLIIVSHGRSGSSLMGDIFNHHPSVFYMYEPLQTTIRVKGRTEYQNYSSLVERFFTDVFQCKFDQPQILADIEGYYRKPDHPRISQAIASPPLCPYRLTDPRWDPQLCYPMTSESVGSACRDNYHLTVLKILMTRIPENSIKTVLSACDLLENAECKVLFLIRDPRAVIPSSRSVGFFTENKQSNAKLSTKLYSYWQCKQTEDNLEFIRTLSNSLRSRIRLQRYEDLAMNPLKELSSLYEFAGLTVLESVRAWLNETTQLSRKDCKHEVDGVAFSCTKDDAWVAANRWRWKVHPHEIGIIEHYCGRAMGLMGYKSVGQSYELLTNVTIPLFSDQFEAKQWFL